MGFRSYVYAYLDPRRKGDYTACGVTLPYQPFYIGKGTGDRMYEHIWQCIGLRYGPHGRYHSHNRDKEDYIRALLAKGMEPVIVKVREEMSEREALDLEHQLINAFGTRRKGGLLTNIVTARGGSRTRVRIIWEE